MKIYIGVTFDRIIIKYENTSEQMVLYIIISGLFTT